VIAEIQKDAEAGIKEAQKTMKLLTKKEYRK
jgi:hypothetical protein